VDAHTDTYTYKRRCLHPQLFRVYTAWAMRAWLRGVHLTTRVDDLLSDLPRHLLYRAIEVLLRLYAARAYQNLKRLEGHYAKEISVTIADRVGVSDAITHTGKRSPAEELF
jgi:hypothetical protein